MTKPIECTESDCKGSCEVGNKKNGFTTYYFFINEHRECFTVYRPLSRSSQSLPVIATVQVRSWLNGLHRLKYNYADFKSTSDTFNRAAAKYGFARILIGKILSNGKLIRIHIYWKETISNTF